MVGADCGELEVAVGGGGSVGVLGVRVWEGGLQVEEGEEHDDSEDVAEDEELVGLLSEWKDGET